MRVMVRVEGDGDGGLMLMMRVEGVDGGEG